MYTDNIIDITISSFCKGLIIGFVICGTIHVCSKVFEIAYKS